MKKNLLVITLALWVGTVCPAWAENAPPKEASPIAVKSVDKTHSQLKQITKRKLIIRKELKELGAKPSSNEVVDRIVDLNKELDGLSENYEALATQI